MATLNKTLLALLGLRQGAVLGVPPGVLAFARLLGLRPTAQAAPTPARPPVSLVLASMLGGAYAPARSEGGLRGWSGGGGPEHSVPAGGGRRATLNTPRRVGGGSQRENTFERTNPANRVWENPLPSHGYFAGQAHGRSGRRGAGARYGGGGLPVGTGALSRSAAGPSGSSGQASRRAAAVAAMAEGAHWHTSGVADGQGRTGPSGGLDSLYAAIRTFQHSRPSSHSGRSAHGVVELSGYAPSGLNSLAARRQGRGFAALPPHNAGQVGAFLDQSCFVPPPAEAYLRGQYAPVAQETTQRLAHGMTQGEGAGIAQGMAQGMRHGMMQGGAHKVGQSLAHAGAPDAIPSGGHGLAQAMVATRQQVQAQWVGSGQAYLQGMGQALSQARSMAARRPTPSAPAVAVPLLAPAPGVKDTRQNYDFQESFLKTHARHANMGLS